MNAAQRRKKARLIKADHHRWPLGTPVWIKGSHHSPDAWGLLGRVVKHGYPCRIGLECLVQFPFPVADLTFGAASFCHYVRFANLLREHTV